MEENGHQQIMRMLKGELSNLVPEERISMIAAIRTVLDEQLVRTQIDECEMRCPNCSGSDFIRYGKTAAGTQRWQCKHCQQVQ